MKFKPENIYHVYNQGNNHERLFLCDDNYQFFLKLFKSYVLPHTEVLAWCLMPNHFHFMLCTDNRCLAIKPQGDLTLDPITNGFRKLLSTYSHEFNKKNDRSGALFRPKTKSQCLDDEAIPYKANIPNDYFFNCFNYIHDNPVNHGLVANAGDWKYSSFNFYYGNSEYLFCNKSLAKLYCSYEEYH